MKIRLDFALLAATGSLNIIAIFAILFEITGTWIGVVIAVVFFLAVADMGRVLINKPGSTNLVRARTWACLLHIVVPIGPFVAPRLLDRLRRPELVSYAVAGNPNLEILAAEGIVALTRVKLSLVSLRAIGGILFIITILCAFTFFMDDYSVTHSKSPDILTDAGITLFVMFLFALSYISASTIGLRLIRIPTRERLSNLRIISRVLLLLIPFGTWTGSLTLFLTNPKRTDFFL